MEDKTQLFAEMEILKELDHPNIMKLLEIWQDKTYYYLISE